MWPESYFPVRLWVARYWPKLGYILEPTPDERVETLAAGLRCATMDAAFRCATAETVSRIATVTTTTRAATMTAESRIWSAEP